eukprot:1813550-Prymnesium_polylepis.1
MCSSHALRRRSPSAPRAVTARGGGATPAARRASPPPAPNPAATTPAPRQPWPAAACCSRRAPAQSGSGEQGARHACVGGAHVRLGWGAHACARGVADQRTWLAWGARVRA